MTPDVRKQTGEQTSKTAFKFSQNKSANGLCSRLNVREATLQTAKSDTVNETSQITSLLLKPFEYEMVLKANVSMTIIKQIIDESNFKN